MNLPFLAVLGIDPKQAEQPPQVSVFPKIFNEQAQHLWEPAVKHGLSQKGKAHEKWDAALNHFVDTAQSQNLFPYARTHQQATNDQIHSFLSRARAQVVKFVNRSRLLDVVSMRQGVRSATALDSGGFIITVDAQVQLKDPTFEKWLIQKPYPALFNINYRWVRKLAPGTTFFVYNEGAHMTQRWHVGYEIICDQWPAVPGNRIPSKMAIEKFAVNVLWDYVLRTNRPDGMLHRIF